MYEFYSTRLIQKKPKFTLVDTMWGLHSKRIDKKRLGAEQISLSCFILCCDHGVCQSKWHFFTAVFCMQEYFHNIYYTSIQPWHILLQIQPLSLTLLNVVLHMKGKYGIYLHSLVLLMDLTLLHRHDFALGTSQRNWANYYTFGKCLTWIWTSNSKIKVLFWSLFSNNKYTVGMGAF